MSDCGAIYCIYMLLLETSCAHLLSCVCVHVLELLVTIISYLSSFLSAILTEHGQMPDSLQLVPLSAGEQQLCSKPNNIQQHTA